MNWRELGLEQTQGWFVLQIRVLGLDPGHNTGYFLSRGYDPLHWGATRQPAADLGGLAPDVVVFEDALDLDRVEPLRPLLAVPWVGITPEVVQRRLFARVLSRHRDRGPAARREVVRRAFGRADLDAHALDAACLVAWYLAGMGSGGPDLGNLQVWDEFTIDAGDGEETYQVVPPNTADPAAGLVSWASPLVQAVCRKRRGEQVAVPAPGGTWHCTLVHIARTDETA